MNAKHTEAKEICRDCEVLNGEDCVTLCPIHATTHELLEALKYTTTLIGVAKRYFPKSIRNSDKFNLLNTGAAIDRAIARAEGRETP